MNYDELERHSAQLLADLRQTKDTIGTILEDTTYAEPGTRTDRVYTTYALTSRGREKIACYETTKQAVEDTLEMWPEEDDGDVVVEDDVEMGVAYFARSDGDPRIVHIYYMGDDRDSVMHVESYRCHYEPALGGSVRTVIERLG